MFGLLREPVCDTIRAPSLRARRPSVREMPGRCGLRLAAEPHRPIFVFDLQLKPAPGLSAARVHCLSWPWFVLRQHFSNPQDVGAGKAKAETTRPGLLQASHDGPVGLGLLRGVDQARIEMAGADVI